MPVSTIVVDLVRAHLAMEIPIAPEEPAPPSVGKRPQLHPEGLERLLGAIQAPDLNTLAINVLREREANGVAPYTAQEFASLIPRLDPSQARAMHLYHVLGVTNKAEIARRMRISSTRVTRLLERGMTNLLFLGLADPTRSQPGAP